MLSRRDACTHDYMKRIDSLLVKLLASTYAGRLFLSLLAGVLAEGYSWGLPELIASTHVNSTNLTFVANSITRNTTESIPVCGTPKFDRWEGD